LTICKTRTKRPPTKRHHLRNDKEVLKCSGSLP
jgi:hypothetical protein